jgi:hypothetical protein
MAKVLLELLTPRPILRHVPVITASCHKGTSRLIGVLSEIKVMVLPTNLLRVTRNLLKATALRCDELFAVLRYNWRSIYLYFEQYASPTQGPFYPNLAQASDIIAFGVPQHDVIEVSSSSYGLSLFSSKAGSPPEENAGLLTMSVGELWPEIDLLDEFAHRGTSAASAQTSRSCTDP